MNNQRGVAISGLLLWGFVIVFVALLGMKVVPEYMDYFKILKSVKSISAGASGQTVHEIREAFDRYADVNYLAIIKGTDLDISKEGNDVVIAFAYERRIPLFYNVSLLIDFHGSSSGH
ncbi:MAG: DUF4845 domain-containing protein [Propionivibrio sp.]|jgi:hypothetical protein|uniref:DUF4845 domain-containing protein n=1 Tax=Candidatus Propionivibrio dominans TaxID=2954373 RepID=A0A9D7F3Z8_9RHOO|nr:DUF4845 domain-containing protein [Candidatus Propionivibrio dominans]